MACAHALSRALRAPLRCCGHGMRPCAVAGARVLLWALHAHMCACARSVVGHSALYIKQNKAQPSPAQGWKSGHPSDS
eukprot:349613-Chlamydomonas_euryale.AAC.4